MKTERREWRSVQTDEELGELKAAVEADGGFITNVRPLRNGTISVNFTVVTEDGDEH